METYIFDTGESNTALISFGGRFIGRNLPIDGALVMPTTSNGGSSIHWRGINVPIKVVVLDKKVKPYLG